MELRYLILAWKVQLILGLDFGGVELHIKSIVSVFPTKETECDGADLYVCRKG